MFKHLKNSIIHFKILPAIVLSASLYISGDVHAQTAIPAPFIYFGPSGNAKIDLSWYNYDPYPQSVTGYTIKYGTAPGNYTSTVNVVDKATEITGLTNGVTYYFVVSAYNATQTSVNSNEVSGVPGRIEFSNAFITNLAFTPNGNYSNETTSVRYWLSMDGSVTIKIYNEGNNLVRTLLNNMNQVADLTNDKDWDGKNDAGVVLPDGLYTFKLDAYASSTGTSTQKILTARIDNAYMTRTTPLDNATITGVTRFRWSPSTYVQYTYCYEFYYRLKGNSNWISPGSGIEESDESCIYDWDTSNLVNGLYETYMSVTPMYGYTGITEGTFPYGTFNVSNGIQINNVVDTVDAISPNGDGKFDTSKIEYILTKAGVSTIKIYNSVNTLVRTLLNNVNQSAGQQSVGWDGKNDAGIVLSDGVYTYKIDAKDAGGVNAAQQTGTLTIDNAYLTRTTPPDNANISGTTQFRWAPSAYVTSTSSCSSFYYRVKGTTSWIYSGTYGTEQTDGSCTYAWNTGIIGNGQYEVKMTVTIYYGNQFHNEDTYPYGTFNVSNGIQINNVIDTVDAISPNGNGNYDTTNIEYVLTKAAAGTIKIYNSGGTLVRTLLNVVNQTAGQQSVVWDGKNDAGVVLADGIYTYKIDAKESNGTAAAQKIGTSTIDNGYMKRTAPADNANIVGVTQFRFAPSIYVTSMNYCSAVHYRVKGTTNWISTGSSGMKQTDGSCTYDWDPGTVSNGQYELRMYVGFYYGTQYHSEYTFPYGTFQIINASKPHFVDTSVFSPNADGVRDSVTFYANFSKTVAWTITIKNSLQTVVKTFSGSGQILAQKWTGVDASNVVVPDGVYSYQIIAKDTANVVIFDESGTLEVDKTPPNAAITVPTASQEVTGYVSIQGFVNDLHFVGANTNLYWGVSSSPVSWTLISNISSASTTATTLSSWSTSGLTSGSYALKLMSTDLAGNTVSKTVAVTVYNVNILNYSDTPDPISPNADGVADTSTIKADLSMSLNWTIVIRNSAAVTVRTLSGTGNKISVVWDAKDNAAVIVPDGTYTYVITAVEPVKNISTSRSDTIMVDRLVPTAVITKPTANQTITGKFQVTGTASDANFANYVLEYGGGSSPSQWNQIKNSSVPVANAELGIFDTFTVSNGTYSLRLTVNDRTGKSTIKTVLVNVIHIDITNVSAVPKFFNPSLGETSKLSFTLPQPCTVKIDLYRSFITSDTLGVGNYGRELVRTLTSTLAGVAGQNTYTWNGKDGAGVISSQGAYTYVINVKNAALTEGQFDPVYVPGPVSVAGVSVSPANYNPYANEPVQLNYTLSAPAWVIIGGLAPANFPGFLVDGKPRLSGVNTESWDGRDGLGKIYLKENDPLTVGIKTKILPDVVSVVNDPSLKITSLKANPYLMFPTYNEVTTISYTTTKTANITLRVVDPSGSSWILNQVNARPAGSYTFQWKGRSSDGSMVTVNGNYRIELIAVDPVSNVTVTRTANVSLYK